ncbi:hypothetical protein [Puerhibacterium sp. TATVAM-FAB25]|uniref:hypothetical protein n=1 Tax=Puerhibacterium sp. TATVAM-FAB25 TaxID=3093699 RepID=UPI003979258B
MSGVVRPEWEWALTDAADRPASGTLSPVFTVQFDAEQWLGEHWRALAGAGVARAQLLHRGEPAGPAVRFPA